MKPFPVKRGLGSMFCLALWAVGSGSGTAATQLILEEYFDTRSDWYDQNQVQQVRHGWTLWHATGQNPLGNPTGEEPWNDWQTPEAIFRWDAFLPPQEWADLLNERGYSYKVFAGNRAWHIRLSTPALSLEPGEYRVSLKYYADTYTWDGQKVAPGDPWAFEAKVNLGAQEGAWSGSQHLAHNVISNVFNLAAPATVYASFELRGRWALNNVGAFVHWFKVEQVAAVGNQPPVSDFDFQMHPGPPPREVAFDASASADPDGDALSYEWDFGDGESGTGETVSHTFLTAGEHWVGCTALDGKGGVGVTNRALTVDPPFGWRDNLVTNADFVAGLNGWSVWVERGTLAPIVQQGGCVLQSGNHNGGVYQTFNTGGAGVELAVDGFWASVAASPNYQWAEVLIINSARQPVNGTDITAADADVVMVYKNDTWTTPAGWRGFLDQTAPVANLRTFVAAGPTATLVLKSGNLGGASTGTRFDDVLVRRANLPQDTDRDGLEDDWEQTHFQNLLQEGWQDPDNDGVTNRDEWEADTLPDDATSWLAFAAAFLDNNTLQVRWHGGFRSFQWLEWSPDLEASTHTWSPIFTNHPPTPITNTVTVPMSGASAVLRLRAMRE